jgi:hypothetical protein
MKAIFSVAFVSFANALEWNTDGKIVADKHTIRMKISCVNFFIGGASFTRD